MILASRLLCNCVVWTMLYFALDSWVAWVRLLSAMWTPFLLEPSCHDGPTPAGSQAASLPPLWTCSMWSLQCRTGFHSCNGFWVWCSCLWSVPHWTERYGVSATICESFTDTVNFLNCLAWNYYVQWIPVYREANCFGQVLDTAVEFSWMSAWMLLTWAQEMCINIWKQHFLKDFEILMYGFCRDNYILIPNWGKSCRE